jgi:type III restriction enzyme
MEERDRDYLVAACPTPEGKAAIEQFFRLNRSTPSGATPRPPAARPTVSVPCLAYRQGTIVRPFDDTPILDRSWKLSTRDALLTESDFPSEATQGQIGEITVTRQGTLMSSFVGELQLQMERIRQSGTWTVADLADWLDRRISHSDITASESGVFLTRAIRALIDQRNLPLVTLERERYRLLTAIAAKIDRYRQDAHNLAFQDLLFPEDTSPVVVDPTIRFTFDPDRYPYNTRYSGAYQFQKHYYPAVGNLRNDGEEFACAQFLDRLPEVKVWIRNLERCPGQSFWLQTSTDRFYPDFVCTLNDGRILVVEYKGDDRWSNDDSKEKRDLGELWARRSGGRCLFVMPKGTDLEAIRQRIRAR